MVPNCDFDAVIVGSGATGGIAAWALAGRGLRVAVLEAGPDLGDAIYATSALGRAAQLARACFANRQQVQRRHPVYWMTNPRLFVSDRDNPYTTPDEAPFAWIRGRQVGGRTHLWGGVCLRFSDHEFAGRERWPVTHRDLDPFYGRVERLLEVCGDRDGLAQLPDGEFAEASALSPGEAHMRDALARRFGRRLVVSRGIRAGRRGEPGHAASRLSSNRTSLAAAMATGRVTLRSDTVVARVTADVATARATGVECVDARTGAGTTLRAPLVVLCASAIESVRILLNSRPIGATSGLLGRGVMDHIACSTSFHLPGLPEATGCALLGSDGALIPRYAFDGDEGGYGYWGGVSRAGIARWLRRRPRDALGFLCGMGEAVRDDDNRVTLNGARADKWGVPCAHIRYAWHADDHRLARRIRDDAAAMIAACGGETATTAQVMKLPRGSRAAREIDRRCEMSPPGLFVHEVGGARMGEDPRRSVADPFGRVWDCANVVLGDGATFVTSGWQNPTLTEMALCLRACEHAADRLRAGAL